jgi:hypothetical protein
MTSVRDSAGFRQVWVTPDGEFQVVDVPLMHGLEAEAAVTVADLLVRMDSADCLDRGGDWVRLGQACLRAGAREMWPHECPREDLDFESTMLAWRGTALRGLAVLAEWVACTEDPAGLRSVARAVGGMCERVTRRVRRHGGW